ncbi:MAG: class I SAM-dependent methyltransferase [Steroidobacteraceae bacterium]
MGLYHHWVFPCLLDRAMTHRMLAAPRQRTLARASGRILEIGFGTGANLDHYPPTVERIEAIDPDVDLDRYARPRIATARVEVEFRHLDAQHLPFAAATFDTVVCTFTLCSIPDVGHALQEVRRVLKRGGRFLFLEHGLAPEPSVARWQRRLDPLQQRLGGGCHLTREPTALVGAAGLDLEGVTHYYLRRVPRFLGYVTEGVAARS